MSALVKSSIRSCQAFEFHYGLCQVCAIHHGHLQFIDDSTGHYFGHCCLHSMIAAEQALSETAGLRRPVQGEQFPENS